MEEDSRGMVKALEKSGMFLHLQALKRIEQHGWTSLIEFPAIGAPFVSDPMKQPEAMKDGVVDPRMFQEVTRRSQNLYSGSKRTVDILASKKIGHVTFRLCVEVKRREPGYVKFVLLKHEKQTSKFSVIYKSNQKGQIDLMILPRINTKGDGLFVTVKQLDLNLFTDKIYDLGRTLVAKQKNEYSFQNNHLREAAKQVVEGTYGVILDSVTRQIVHSSEREDECFVPVIVTNAEIYSCSYDPENMDPDSGEGGDKELKSKDCAVYKSPMLASTTFPNQATGAHTPEQMEQVSRWPVVVTSMKGLQRLLEAIDGSRPVGDGTGKRKTAPV